MKETFVFIDWENTRYSVGTDVRGWADRLRAEAGAGSGGRMTAYANWKFDPAHEAEKLYYAGIDLVHVPTQGEAGVGGVKRNSVDLKVCMDVLRHATGRPPTRYVVCSGDGDFVHLIRELRALGHEPVIHGPAGTTSRSLSRATKVIPMNTHVQTPDLRSRIVEAVRNRVRPGRPHLLSELFNVLSADEATREYRSRGGKPIDFLRSCLDPAEFEIVFLAGAHLVRLAGEPEQIAAEDPADGTAVLLEISEALAREGSDALGGSFWIAKLRKEARARDDTGSVFLRLSISRLNALLSEHIREGRFVERDEPTGQGLRRVLRRSETGQTVTSEPR